MPSLDVPETICIRLLGDESNRILRSYTTFFIDWFTDNNYEAPLRVLPPLERIGLTDLTDDDTALSSSHIGKLPKRRRRTNERDRTTSFQIKTRRWHSVYRRSSSPKFWDRTINGIVQTVKNTFKQRRRCLSGVCHRFWSFISNVSNTIKTLRSVINRIRERKSKLLWIFRSSKVVRLSTRSEFRRCSDLDMSPYCSSTSTDANDPSHSRYDLFGIINHSGTAWFGHYTADARLLTSNDPTKSEIGLWTNEIQATHVFFVFVVFQIGDTLTTRVSHRFGRQRIFFDQMLTFSSIAIDS